MRGLSVDKEDRFPRMSDLLDALVVPKDHTAPAAVHRTSRRQMVVIGVFAALAAVGLFADLRCNDGPE